MIPNAIETIRADIESGQAGQNWAASNKKRQAVQGPPGCGKTYYAAQKCAEGSDKYGAHQVKVASLTRTASKEIAGRAGLPDGNVSTLHSLCASGLRQALGISKINNAEAEIPSFNEWVGVPALQLTPQRGAASQIDIGLDEATGDNDGDALYSSIGIRRARLQPVETWPGDERYFFGKWCEWKELNHFYDFQDLIEQAYLTCPTAPGEPDLMLCDESQDQSTAELALLTRWSRGLQELIVAGDPDQSLYVWRGADPDRMFPDNPYNKTIILDQSYRVPEAVRNAAVTWLSSMPGYRRVDYNARRDPKTNKVVSGSVKRSPAHFENPDILLPHLLADTGEGKTSMVQASCAYMLKPLIALLKKEGIPFHNPWRKTNGAWNPLGPSENEKEIFSLERIRGKLLAFLAPSIGGPGAFYTAEQLRAWGTALQAAGVFNKGQKRILQQVDPAAVMGPTSVAELMRQCLTPEAIAAARGADLAWYSDNLESKYKKQGGTAYALAVLDRLGVPGLSTPPLITLGTIHSLKGSEADRVYLFPDLSFQGENDYAETPANTYRLFYVGMTRARESLTLCAAASERAIFLPSE